MFFWEIAFGAIGLGLGAWYGSLLCCVTVGLTLLIYLLLLLQDFHSLNRALEKSLAEFQSELKKSDVNHGRTKSDLSFKWLNDPAPDCSRKVSFVPQTSYGRRAVSGLSALRYRLAAKHWEAFVPEIDSLELCQSNSLSDGAAENNSRKSSPLFARLLQLLRSNFRAVVQAIVVAPVPGELNCRCYLAGRSGEAFETCLLRAVTAYFYSGDSGCFGQHDFSVAKGLDSVMLQFGLGHSLCFPFEHYEEGRRVRALLWLGYSEVRPPFEIEQARAEKFAKRLSCELKSNIRLSEMEARVWEAESKNQQKSEYIAHVSHDIRSPLNNIKSILGLLSYEMEQQPNIQELIEIALTNCTNLAEIVEDVLDYAKHQAGQLTARNESFSLVQIVEQVIAGFSVSARLKGLDLKFSHDRSSTFFIYGDKRHIKRVVSNLVSNAIKYTDRGEVELTLLSSGSGSCILTVRDTGIGMEPDLVQEIFKPFHRGNHKEIEGVGLGLALAKILLELSSARVVVSSEVGVGSEFTVIFPVNQVKEQEGYLSQRVIQVGASDSLENAHLLIDPNSACKTGHLLIIDDDSDCVETLARNLRLDGFRVTEALSLRDAFNIMNFEKPDLILTDAKMAGGGVEKVLKVVAARYPGLPVIVISGLGTGADRKRLLTLGADEVFEKPVDMELLKEQIQASLGSGSDTQLLKRSSRL